jgi:hypothetical protein
MIHVVEKGAIVNPEAISSFSIEPDAMRISTGCGFRKARLAGY